MKTRIVWVLVVSLFGMASCFSENSDIKDKAIQYAQKDFTDRLYVESSGLPQSKWFRNEYVVFMSKYSEFSVDDIKDVDGKKIATVSIKAYPESARKIVIKIAAKLSMDESQRFNFANALQLISQQTGESTSQTTEPFQEYTFQKDANGVWK